MVSKYNDVTGRKKKGGLSQPPQQPHVKVPFVLVQGVWVRAETATWNNHKQAFWVDFGGGFRDWVPEPNLVWQTALLWPES